MNNWMACLRSADDQLIPARPGPHPSARVLNTGPRAPAQVEAVTPRVAAIGA